MLKLNLGCGKHRIPGFVNVDKYGVPDVTFDLETFPWPWSDNSVDEMVLNHVLEHLGQDVSVYLKIIQEIYRVSENGARIRIQVPHTYHHSFIDDPTHVRAITPEGLALFSQKENKHFQAGGYSNTLLAFYYNVDLELESVNYALEEAWEKKRVLKTISDEELLFAIQHYHNVIKDIHITLVVRK